MDAGLDKSFFNVQAVFGANSVVFQPKKQAVNFLKINDTWLQYKSKRLKNFSGLSGTRTHDLRVTRTLDDPTRVSLSASGKAKL